MEDSGSSYASPFRNRSRVGQPGRLPSHVYSQVTDCLLDFTLTPRLTLGVLSCLLALDAMAKVIG